MQNPDDDNRPSGETIFRPEWVENGAERTESFRNAAAMVRRVVAQRHVRPSLVSELACEIGAEIIEGIRQPGEDLNSVDLSTQYRTSRTPIREALMLLEKEGLVDIPPRRRPRVMKWNASAVRDIYHTRSALLELVVAKVAVTATPEQIDELADQLEIMKADCAARNYSAYLWSNTDFHEKNNRIANNQVVTRILDSLHLRSLSFRKLSLSRPEGIERSCRDHSYLLQAYRDRDPVLAQAIMRSNIAGALKRLEGFLAAEEATSKRGQRSKR
ncbi:GntR family transcriptional regulator [Chelativorans sp. Marseille-P2723]|uniref:GntR family transcriptional regulator n=1 Tax=Chelativorans sp. Marseille-P2723 TaxID=2709133 RepID=UPI00156E4E5F|nr:GntR family transcriptional regulator [Chelativorans sp. Marseille-P2723]